MSSTNFVEFLGKIRRIQSIMIQVVTGKAGVPEKESEYLRLYEDLYEDFKRRGLGNPNQFPTLNGFSSYCHMYYPKWEDRRRFIKSLYKSVPGLTEETSNEVQQKRLSVEKTRTNVVDRRKIFVVYGRNIKARDALFMFLRSIDLHPMEWSEIIATTGRGAPYIAEILDKAFSQAQAVVVLMTPDDEGRLRKHFRKLDDRLHETELTPQARLNVLFEAGMAIGHFPNRTILVELGDLRPFSDIGGRHVVRLDDSTQKRQELAQRLKDAGCKVNLIGTDWHTAGEFKASLSNASTIETNMRPSRRIAESKAVFSSFDKSLRSLEKATQPKTRAILLSKFQPVLRSLCQDHMWSDGVKDRIEKTIEIIPKKLSENPNIDNYIQFLKMILNHHGEHTLDMIKKKFMVDLEKAYLDPKYKTNAVILSLLQRLHEYSLEYMMKLVDDAVYKWSDGRFNTLNGAIEFWGLKERDKEHEGMLRFLEQKMEETEKDRDEKAHSRFKQLYSSAYR